MMQAAAGLNLGRVAGIQVRVDWSLLIIFLLIATSLGAGLFPSWHPDWTPGTVWGTAIAAALLFFVSVLIHEMSHALVGRRFGIEVQRITLFMFGGMAEMRSEPPHWKAELWMALAGPLASVALGVAFGLLAGLLAGPVEIDPRNPAAGLSALNPAATLLVWLAPINLILAAFNLVPGFPLDGGRVLRAILWGATDDLVAATRYASRGGQFVAWTLMALGFAMMLGIRVPFFGVGLMPGVWLAFIGWFLNSAALASYRQLLLRESLEDVPVSRLMQTNFVRVPPDMSVARLVEDVVMASGQHAFPVEEAGVLRGIVCLRDLRRGAPDAALVHEVMTPFEALTVVGPDTDAMEALTLLGRRQLNQLPVVTEGRRLVGLLRREDVVTWLTLRGAPGNGKPMPASMG